MSITSKPSSTRATQPVALAPARVAPVPILPPRWIYPLLSSDPQHKTWYDAFVLDCRRSAKDLLKQKIYLPPDVDGKLLKSWSIAAENNAKYGPNPHAIGAAARYYMNLFLASTVCQEAYVGRVRIDCGSWREANIFLSTPYGKRGLLEVNRPLIDAQDNSRRLKDIPPHCLSAVTTLVMQDVFQYHDQTLLQYFASQIKELLYFDRAHFVIKKYIGMFGDSLYGEGAYYRDDGRIHFKPSLLEAEYDTPDCAEFYQPDCREVDGVWMSWAVKKIVGEELYVQLTSNRVLPARSSTDSLRGLVRVQVPKRTYLSRMMWEAVRYCPVFVQSKFLEHYGESLSVDARLLAALTQYMSARRATGWTYVTGATRVATEWLRNQCPKFCALYPERLQKIVDDHCYAAWISSREGQHANMEMVHMASAKQAQINGWIDTLSVDLSREVPWWSVFQIFLFMGLIYYYRQPASKLFSMFLRALDTLKAISPKLSIPGLQPWMEEAIRYLLPTSVGTVGLAVCDSYLQPGLSLKQRAIVFGGQFLLSLPRYFCSGWKSKLTLWVVMSFMHTYFNARKEVLKSKGQVFLDSLRCPKPDNDSANHEDIGNSPVTWKDTIVPPLAISKVATDVPPEHCDRLLVKGDIEAIRTDQEVRGPISVFFASTNVELYSPSNNGEMLMRAVEARVLKPALNYDGQQTAWAGFRKTPLFRALNEMIGEMDPILRDPFVVETYLKHFPPSKEKFMRRANQSFEKTQGGQQDDLWWNRIRIMSKKDEHLVRPNFLFKPRIVASVAPEVQCALGPQLRIATLRLHEKWCCDHPFKYGKMNYYLSFACGMTDIELGYAVLFAISTPGPACHIMVCGDDSVVILKFDDEHISYFECDLSSYDQAQGEQVLETEYDLLMTLGILKEDVLCLRRLSRASYFCSFNSESIMIKRRNRPMRDTGAPDTTIGNSIVNVCLWLQVFGEDFPVLPAVLTTRFAQLGFEAKLKEVPDVIHLSFLKGMFYQCPLGYVWGPLPSRIIKMGKCRGDPRQIYKIPDLEDAVLYHCAAQASTYAQYSQVPLIRVFVQKYQKADVEDFDNQILHMIHGTGVAIEFPLDQVAEHYDIDKSEFVECEDLIREAKVPCVTFHPLFARIGSVDYC